MDTQISVIVYGSNPSSGHPSSLRLETPRWRISDDDGDYRADRAVSKSEAGAFWLTPLGQQISQEQDLRFPIEADAAQKKTIADEFGLAQSAVLAAQQTLERLLAGGDKKGFAVMSSDPAEDLPTVGLVRSGPRVFENQGVTISCDASLAEPLRIKVKVNMNPDQEEGNPLREGVVTFFSAGAVSSRTIYDSLVKFCTF